MKSAIRALSAAAVLILSLSSGSAQEAPGPLNLIVPAPPGGANDSLARLLGAKLQELTGQPVVILNKPGGNLLVGTEFVIRSKPDGRTLLVVGNSALTVNPVLYPSLPYDPQKDLQPVSRLAVLELILAVHPSVPVNSVAEFISYAKANAKTVNYAAGTPVFQLAMEKFKFMTGAPITHIPYNGTARANLAVLSGEVQATISESTVSVPQIKAGKLKAIAGIPRINALPDVPPITNSLPGFDMTVWLGLFAPRGTPASAIASLSNDIARVYAQADMQQRLVAMGMRPVGGSPDELAKIIEQDLSQVRQLVKTAGIKAN